MGTVTTCQANGSDTTINEMVRVVSVNEDPRKIWDQVHGMTVENQNWERFPWNIDKFVPNLRALKVSNSNLKILDKFDIGSLTELVVLSLTQNKLQYIESDVFLQNTKIRYLTLIDNNLLVINGPILDAFKFLHYVDISIPCLTDKCEYSDCIAESTVKFREKCEFDVVYPGFKGYYERRLYCEHAAFIYEENVQQTDHVKQN